MATNILTPLQLIAGASLLQNQGLLVSPALTQAINSYANTAVISAFLEAWALDNSIATLGATTVPALSNSIPAAYANIGTQMTTVISNQATADFASGDISKFIQALNLVEAYTQNTNLFINSAVNSQTYLANTFTSTNDSITGDVTSVNLATPAFGQDLANLGTLIDLGNLSDLGSPLALVKRLVEVSGNIPVLTAAFVLVGVPTEIVFNLSSPTLTVTDSVQKLMYQAMTQITGPDLDQILQILNVTTKGINTMADLLDPVKLFPNSFASLTVKTGNGLRSIYENSNGAVNSKIVNDLPPYVVGETV